MAQYRTRSVIVEAAQFFPELKPWPGGVTSAETSPTGFALITGGEIAPGDWVLRGVDNTAYACAADIFEAIYEPVE